MAQIQQGGLLDVLKKKMRQTKEEMEKYKDDCEELQKKLHLEVMRREEVSFKIDTLRIFIWVKKFEFRKTSFFDDLVGCRVN